MNWGSTQLQLSWGTGVEWLSYVAFKVEVETEAAVIYEADATTTIMILVVQPAKMMCCYHFVER